MRHKIKRNYRTGNGFANATAFATSNMAGAESETGMGGTFGNSNEKTFGNSNERSSLKSHKNKSSKSKPKSGMFFLFLMLIAGVALGTVAVVLADNTEIFKQYMVHGGLFPEKEGLIHNMVYYSSGLFIFTAFLFVFGFCAIGQPATLAILLLRGFSIGCAVSSLYMEFGKSAITEALTLIVPFAVLTAFVLLLSARESIKFSNYFAAYAIKNEGNGKSNVLKLYLLKYFVIVIMLGILVFVQSLVLSLV